MIFKTVIYILFLYNPKSDIETTLKLLSAHALTRHRGIWVGTPLRKSDRCKRTTREKAMASVHLGHSVTPIRIARLQTRLRNRRTSKPSSAVDTLAQTVRWKDMEQEMQGSIPGRNLSILLYFFFLFFDDRCMRSCIPVLAPKWVKLSQNCEI